MAHRNKSSMDYIGLGCCALAFVLYLNTLDAGFVYDDRRAVLGNPDVIGTAPWNNMLKNDFWGTPLTDSGSHGSYRPLCVLSFKLNYIFGGFRPLGYHLVNVLLHCLATGLVVKLSRQLLPMGWGPAITGALFASHPIHTEAVAGVVGRADLAACNFYLLAFLFYLKHIYWREKGDVRHWLALGGTIILSAMAVLCKETAVTALLVCAIYDVVRSFNGAKDKNRLKCITILGLSLLTILKLRLMLPGPKTLFSTADNPIAKSNSILTRFLTFSYLPVFNFNLLVYPHQLSFDWGMDALPRISSVNDVRNIVTIIFYLIFFGTIWTNSRLLLSKKLPSLVKSVIKRKGRAAIKKLKLIQQQQIMQQQQNDIATINNLNSNNNNNNNNNNSECFCTVCKYGLNIRHSSSCRAQNNNNNPLPSVPCECVPLTKTMLLTLNVGNHILGATSKKSSMSSSSSSCSSSSSSGGSRDRSELISSLLTTHNINSNDITQPPPPATSVVILLSISLLTLPFLPAANLFFYVGFVVAERILYLPSVGYCLLIGLGLGKILEIKQFKIFGCGTIIMFKNKKLKNFMVLISVVTILIFYCLKTVHRNSDWKNEESLYRSAVGINPPKALGNLGSVLSAQGRYEEAKIALLEALKFRPNMADVHYNLGIILQNQQDYKGAIESFQKAIHFRPSLALAYLNLGTSLIALGRCQEAAAVLREGSKLDGTGLRDRDAHENARIASLLQLGNLYADQGKLQRALAVYREALHSLPDRYPPQSIYHRLGDILSRLHQWNEAERFHRAALEVEPNHVATHLSYGTMLARNSSRASEAEQWFKRALRLAPTDSSVYHHYAEFLTSVSRHKEACEQRIRAAELSPKDYSLVVSAATALRLLDKKNDAEKWYRKAVQLRPDDARAHTNLGAILHLIGRTNDAAVSYREALKLQPGDPTTLANLAKLGIMEVA